MENKKGVIIVFISILIVLSITGVDMDFGVFNYNGSRLKEIRRKGEHKISYQYDKKGYLIGRILTKGLQKIYISEITYDFENNVIIEKFIKYIGFKYVGNTYLKYYYDKNKRFIKLIRENENIDTKIIEETINMSVEYNENGDIVRIYDTTGIPQYIFFPGDGTAYWSDSIFKYEYEDDKKTQYIYNSPNNKLHEDKESGYYVFKEYYFDNKYLNKIITYPVFTSDKISTTNSFLYDKNMNLIETIFYHFDYLKNIKTKTKIIYKYDNKNRLKKRTIYYPDSISKNKIQEVEEYIYEDGDYIYYPYLLPPKIKMYLNQNYEISVDKYVF
ncbi:MAG TPA: hypothetical protein PLG34_05675 [Spirochaetota bacterium]|jgi:hypothetical protein|nr:MAG: hypothetical protein BWX91_01857 [Spirochaetes bacterium ADurb.Bin133]HNZ26635.1 hypothetical protein [Spirochaetota bacterium]HPY87451.1 hypothetical protein [Spirochaetota bacterium]HQB60052.1 hypothetical protein [Spirochaetota bacterium]